MLSFPHLIYGGDYNPEQWGHDVWREDARLMQEAGVNLVSLGIFSWALLEPAPGEYSFGWLDDVIELLHAHGIRVNLATATASPPPWLSTLYPDSLPVTAEGVRLWHGSRRHYCPHSPDYHRHASALVTELGKRYGSHPAVAMWHIDNEYGCHVSECFCDTSMAAFRRWLQGRYTTLDTLNEAWGTSFWSQHYGEWEEVIGPRRTPAQNNPSQRLDWLRFCSDSWIGCYDEQATILRHYSDAPLTTNFMGFFKPIDYWKFAEAESVVSNDAYPDPSDPESVVYAGMMCDLMRSLGSGAPWVLMEQAPSLVNWRERNAVKRPGRMRLGSYQAVGRGANGVMFFQWRASRAGSERFHSGMVPHAGVETRTWREVKALGNELSGLDALLGGSVDARVAILFDWENWWALEGDSKPSSAVKMLPALQALYGELFRRNVAVDFALPEHDLSKYSLVIAPNLYLVSDRAAENLNAWVAAGGTLLMTFFSGIVTPHDHVRLGGYPAPFRQTLGMWVEEFAPMAEGEANSVKAAGGQTFACDLWADVIHLEGAQPLASFTADYYAGGPAVTRHDSGGGKAIYCGTRLDAPGLSWLVGLALDDAGARPVLPAPEGVEVTLRADDEHRWYFILNHATREVELSLPGAGLDLLTGAPVPGSIRLGPVSAAIVQLDLPGA